MAGSSEEPCCSRSLLDSKESETVNEESLEDSTNDETLRTKREEARTSNIIEEIQPIAYFRVPSSGRVNFYDYPENPMDKYGPAPGAINIVNEYQDVLNIFTNVLPPQRMTLNNMYKKARSNVFMLTQLKRTERINDDCKQLHKMVLLRNTAKQLRQEDRYEPFAPPEMVTEEQQRVEQLAWAQVQNYYYQVVMCLKTELPFSMVRECHDILHPPFFHISHYLISENSREAYRIARQYVIDTAYEKQYANTAESYKVAQMKKKKKNNKKKKKKMKKAVPMWKQFMLKTLTIKLEVEEALEILQDDELRPRD